MHKISLLGVGLIGQFYTDSIQGGRKQDRVHVAYSRTEARVSAFAAQHRIPKHTTDLRAAIEDPDTDTVVVGLPNHLHEEAITLAAQAGKAVLCTKPLARTGAEALRILNAVEKAGVFHGYLEDLVYTPKTLRALQSVKNGAVGKVLWARSRETHPGPHSDWFWDKEQSGGGAIIDLGCHCIEINRNFIGKEHKPLEVMCWGDTQVHPIETEDSAVGLVRYANGAIGQFEVSWTFRGGMDLRDEVSGTQGTIWLNHWLRTGYEMFTAHGEGGYVAEKAEEQATKSRWQGTADLFLFLMPQVAAVAGEHLVSAIAGKRHRHMLAGQGTDPICRHGRTVAIGLVIDAGKLIDEIEGIGIDLAHAMRCVIALGHVAGVGGLVEVLVRERDGKRIDGLGAAARHQGHDAA